MTPGYATLVALAELELELVWGGRWDELDELAERRDRIARALPSIAPPAARPDLERLSGIRAEIDRVLRAGLSRTADELRAQRSRGQALRGYAATA